MHSIGIVYFEKVDIHSIASSWNRCEI